MLSKLLWLILTMEYNNILISFTNLKIPYLEEIREKLFMRLLFSLMQNMLPKGRGKVRVISEASPDHVFVSYQIIKAM